MKTKKNQTKVMSFRCNDPALEQMIEQMAKSQNKKLSVLLQELIQIGIDAPAQIAQLQQQLSVFDTASNRELFERYQGREAKFEDENGNQFKIPLNNYEDLQKVYYHSFDAVCAYAKKYGYNYR